MKTYSVVVSYWNSEEWLEIAKSTGLAPILQLAGLICQHATEDVSSVAVWEANDAGPILVVFSWSPKGAAPVQEEAFISPALSDQLETVGAL